MLSRTTKPTHLTEPPGVPCPRCKTPIRLTLPKLLAGTPVFCSECGLELTLDRHASTDALDAARTMQELTKGAEERK
jgi:hypothetical protein